MRSITRLADLLLGAMVPEVRAGACCGLDGTRYKAHCYCSGLYEWTRNCVVGCDCKATCTACYKTTTQC
jgi:hypothetical protein